MTNRIQDAQVASKTSQDDPRGNRVGIWIDTEQAILIPMIGKEPAIRTVTMDAEKHKRIKKRKLGGLHGGVPSHSEKQEQSSLDEEMRRYLEEVTEAIGNAHRIVVFGPAYVKQELGKALANDPRFKATEVDLVTADRMTPNQMVAWVKRYFQ